MPRFGPRRTASLLALCATIVAGCAAPPRLGFDPIDAGTEMVPLAAAVDPTDDVAPVEADPAQVDPAPVDASAADTGAVDTADGDIVDVGADDVVRALGALLDRWVECFHSPADCYTARLTAPGSPERDRLAEAAAYYAGEQIRTKPDEGRLEWGVESVLRVGASRARVAVCEYDTRVYFDSSMADTELGDIIFDTTIWTRRVEWTLARENDEWKLWSRRVDRRSPVARFCTP